MRLPLPLTRILGAAIVMIAVYAMPSAAFAHQGHGTDVSAASSIASAENTASVEGSNAAEAQPSGRTAQQASRQPADERPCNAVCCTGGASCCAPAIDTSSSGLDSPQRVRTLVLPRAAVFGGVDPNLFRRPPRSFV